MSTPVSTPVSTLLRVLRRMALRMDRYGGALKYALHTSGESATSTSYKRRCGKALQKPLRESATKAVTVGDGLKTRWSCSVSSSCIAAESSVYLRDSHLGRVSPT